jgi:hypothetical protein
MNGEPVSRSMAVSGEYDLAPVAGVIKLGTASTRGRASFVTDMAINASSHANVAVGATDNGVHLVDQSIDERVTGLRHSLHYGAAPRWLAPAWPAAQRALAVGLALAVGPGAARSRGRPGRWPRPGARSRSAPAQRGPGAGAPLAVGPALVVGLGQRRDRDQPCRESFGSLIGTAAKGMHT